MDDPPLSVHLVNDVRAHVLRLQSATTHLDNFSSLLAFEVATGDHDFVVLSNRKGPHVVFLPELLRQGCTHDDPAYAGGGRKMPLSAFPPRGGHVPIELHRADKMAEGKNEHVL